jgi:hypothetical protein
VRKTALAAIALSLGGTVSAGDAAPRSRRPGRVGQAVPARLAHEGIVIGMIRYDTGVNAGFHPDAVAGNLNRVVGNRFNTNLGGPLLMTNRVFSLTVFPAVAGDQSVSIATGPNSMGSAMVLEYLNANLMANQFNSIQFNPPVSVGFEFVGLFMGVFGSSQPAGLVGMSDMSVYGQGYHAIEGFYQNPLAVTMLQAVPNRNAMVRARIDVFPVELMDFRIQ